MIKLKKIDWIILILGILSLIGMIVFLTGCDELSSKLLPEMNDKIDDVHKVSVKTQDAVDGNNNTLSEINDNSKLSIQTFNKRMDTISNQINDSATVSAKEIGNLTQKVNNTNNSTILMIILFSISAVLCIMELGIIFWTIRKVFSMKTHIKRIFESPDNDLDEDKWNGMGNAPKI